MLKVERFPKSFWRSWRWTPSTARSSFTPGTREFLNECPTGRISQEQFESIYASFFPDADPKAYAQHVFRSFDANSDGTLDFKEYIVALHLTSSGKTVEKLEWAFALYDVDRNGTITKNEIHEIVKVKTGTDWCRHCNHCWVDCLQIVVHYWLHDGNCSL